MKRVKATREGLIGNSTSMGIVITPYLGLGHAHLSNFFVALPDTKAIRRIVRVRNPANDREVMCPVIDVGPWNEHDSDYVFGDFPPAAESGIDTRGRKTNGAGIDLSEGVWAMLGMTDNTEVEWEFV